MNSLLKGLIATSTALVFPHYCPWCGDEGGKGDGWVCEACWDMLEPSAGAPKKLLKWARENAFIAYRYDDLAQELIRQMKFNGREDVAREFGKRIATLLVEWRPGASFDAVTPVPLHRTRVRERGYDQDLVIAKQVAARLGLPLRSDLICKTVHTAPQSRLSDAERVKTQLTAFSPREGAVDIPDSVLLVDDVIHTGATIIGAARALGAAGVRTVSALVACG